MPKNYNEKMAVVDGFVYPYVERVIAMTPEELEQKGGRKYNFLHALAGFTRERKMLRDQIVAVLLAARVGLPCGLGGGHGELNRGGGVGYDSGDVKLDFLRVGETSRGCETVKGGDYGARGTERGADVYAFEGDEVLAAHYERDLKGLPIRYYPPPPPSLDKRKQPLIRNPPPQFLSTSE